MKGGGRRQGEDWIQVQVGTDRAGQKGRNDSVDKGEQKEESRRARDGKYSLCYSLYHRPRSWRMNSDPSQPSAEAR